MTCYLDSVSFCFVQDVQFVFIAEEHLIVDFEII